MLEQHTEQVTSRSHCIGRCSGEGPTAWGGQCDWTAQNKAQVHRDRQSRSSEGGRVASDMKSLKVVKPKYVTVEKVPMSLHCKRMNKVCDGLPSIHRKKNTKDGGAFRWLMRIGTPFGRLPRN